MSQKDLIANKQAIRLINSQETITPTERKTLLQFKGNGSIARDIEALTPNRFLHLNPYQYVISEGKLYQKLPNQNIIIVTEETERIKDAIAIRTILEQLIDEETTKTSDEEINPTRRQLHQAYWQFTQKWGNLLKGKNKSILSVDSKLNHLIHSLEYKDENNRLKQALILTDRVSYPTRKITRSIKSATDALYYTYNENQFVNLNRIANLCGKTVSEVITTLSDKRAIFYNPKLEKWELAHVYLNGDTKAKLYAVKNASAEEWEKYRLNINHSTLTQTDTNGDYVYIRPFLLPPCDLENRNAIAETMVAEFGLKSDLSEEANFLANLGTPWLEPRHIEEFTAWLLETVSSQIRCHQNQAFAIWKVETVGGEAHWLSQKSAYASQEKDVITLINHGLNHSPPIIKIMDSDGKKLKLESSRATNNAVSKLEKIQEKFTEWLWSDYERALHYTKKYNQLFPREINYYQINQHHSQLVLKGSNSKIQLKPHQLQGVERSLLQQNTLLLWEVGTGKTYTIISAAYQAKQKGIVNKPLIVVPKATLPDLAQSYQELYPRAKLLTIEADNFVAGIAQLQCGDYDSAITTHDCFYRIPISEETKINYMKQEIKIINSLLEENNCKEIKKELEKARADFENQVQELEIEQTLNESENKSADLRAIANVYGKRLKIQKNGKIKIKRRDDEATKSQGNLEKAFHYYNKPEITPWEKLGVDYLLFDEAHALKNLKTPSRINRVQGADLPYTQRTMNSLLKFRYCAEERGGKLLWATGTLPTNSLTELYVAQRFLQPKTLERKGILSFDAWVGQFGSIETKLEITATGQQKEKSRLTKFKNLQELLDITQEVTDFAKSKTVLGDLLPTPQYYTVVSPPTVEQQKINEHLSAIDSLLQKQEEITYINREGKEMPYNFLSLTNLGTTTAIDPRNVLPDANNDPYLKLNQVGLNAYNIWQNSSYCKGTQIIFCDQGIPRPNQFTNQGYLKAILCALGIPEAEIAMISEISDKKRKDLYQKINQGKIRVLIGSTEKCGTGVNIQEKLIAIHHVDLPWAPYKKQQREGRIIRRGNSFPIVFIFQYGTLGKNNHPGFDAYKSKRIADKTKFVEQFSSGNLTNEQRQTHDLEENDISNHVVQALLSGSQSQMKRMELETQLILTQQNLSKAKQQWSGRTTEAKKLPTQISQQEERVEISRQNYEKVRETPNNKDIVYKDKTGLFRVPLTDSTYEFKSRQQAIKLVKKIRSGESLAHNEEKLKQLKIQQEKLPKTIMILETEIKNLETRENQLEVKIEALKTEEEKEVKHTEILDIDLSNSQPVRPYPNQVQEIKETGFYQMINVQGVNEDSNKIYQDINEQCHPYSAVKRRSLRMTVGQQLAKPTETKNKYNYNQELRQVIPKESTKGKQLCLF